MIEAMWSIYFVEQRGGNHGAGIVILENGLVRGGDSSYFYKGDYLVKDGDIQANVDVKHYYGNKNNIFGPLDIVTVQLQGKIAYDQFIVQGISHKGQPVKVLFKREAEISR